MNKFKILSEESKKELLLYTSNSLSHQMDKVREIKIFLNNDFHKGSVDFEFLKDIENEYAEQYLSKMGFLPTKYYIKKILATRPIESCDFILSEERVYMNDNYKDVKVICLVYDISNKKSFTELKDYQYEQQTKLNVDGEPIFAVVGNKYDLYETTQVDDEAKNFAKSIGAIFQYTSAKNASGITELFNNIGEKYFNPNLDINEQENKEKEIYEKKKLEKAQKKNENKNKGGVKLDSSIHQQKQQKKGCC